MMYFVLTACKRMSRLFVRVYSLFFTELLLLARGSNLCGIAVKQHMMSRRVVR